jgi:hypothetical protein
VAIFLRLTGYTVQEGTAQLERINTDEQSADIFTKEIHITQLQRFSRWYLNKLFTEK